MYKCLLHPAYDHMAYVQMFTSAGSHVGNPGSVTRDKGGVGGIGGTPDRSVEGFALLGAEG